MLFMDLLRYWVAFTLALWLIARVPPEFWSVTDEYELFPSSEGLRWLSVFLLGALLSLTLHALLFKRLLTAFGQWMERLGLVFIPGSSALHALNQELQRPVPEVERIRQELARILRHSPTTELSMVSVMLARNTLALAHALDKVRTTQSREEDARRRIEEDEAASPLGQLAAAARKAHALDRQVTPQARRPDPEPRL